MATASRHARSDGAAPSGGLDAISRYMEGLPHQARLDYYSLSHAERSLLRAMCSCSPPAGLTVWLSEENLGVRANLSRKHVQRLIHGWKDERNGTKHMGLKARGILTEVAKANRGRRRPATYRVNWDAFEIDPAHVGILERRMQMMLPGVKRPAAPGEEIIPQPATAGDTCDTVSHVEQKLPLIPVVQKPVENLRMESGHMRHRVAPDASPCRSTCVTVSHRVLDLSSRSSNRKPNQQLAESKQGGPVEIAGKAGSSKSAWQQLPGNLQRKMDREIDLIREARVGSASHSDERTPEEIAGEVRHLLLVAGERAGIWPQVSKQIAQETYDEVLADERAKQKNGGQFDA